MPVRGTSHGRSTRPTGRKIQTVDFGDEAYPQAGGTTTGTTESDALLQDAGYDGHTSREYQISYGPSRSAVVITEPSTVNATHTHVTNPEQSKFPSYARPPSILQPGWVDKERVAPTLNLTCASTASGRGTDGRIASCHEQLLHRLVRRSTTHQQFSKTGSDCQRK